MPASLTIRAQDRVRAPTSRRISYQDHIGSRHSAVICRAYPSTDFSTSEVAFNVSPYGLFLSCIAIMKCGLDCEMCSRRRQQLRPFRSPRTRLQKARPFPRACFRRSFEHRVQNTTTSDSTFRLVESSGLVQMELTLLLLLLLASATATSSIW